MLVEGVANFKYLGSPLDQTDNDWPEMRRNTKGERTVWRSLGEMLRRKGGDPRVAAMLYKAVAKVVLLFWIRDLGVFGSDVE